MNTILSFIRRYPLPVYYSLVFLISWGGVLLLIGGPGNIPGTPEEAAQLLPVGIMAMLLGPSFAGLLLTGLVHGRAGYRELFARLFQQRVVPQWYAVALLGAPLLMLALLSALSLLSADFRPGIFSAADKPALLLLGLLGGLGAGIFEELGWTGFVLPIMRRRFSALATGLYMGFLWGAWHYIVNFWGSGDASGAFDLRLLIPSLLWSVSILPAFRVLMVWVWDRTGSLLIAMLMHLSLTCGMILFDPQEKRVLLSYDLLLAAALVLIAAIVLARSAAPRRQTRSKVPSLRVTPQS